MLSAVSVSGAQITHPLLGPGLPGCRGTRLDDRAYRALRHAVEQAPPSTFERPSVSSISVGCRGKGSPSRVFAGGIVHLARFPRSPDPCPPSLGVGFTVQEFPGALLAGVFRGVGIRFPYCCVASSMGFGLWEVSSVPRGGQTSSSSPGFGLVELEMRVGPGARTTRRLPRVAAGKVQVQAGNHWASLCVV